MSRERTTPYRTGFCLTGAHGKCAGEVRNGANAPKPVVACGCECHPEVTT